MTFLGSFKKMFGSNGGDERTELEKKVRAMPNDPQLRQKLALVHLKQRHVVEGVAELAKAAELYEKDGFAGKAIAVLRQLLKYDIENVEMQQRLIGLLARQGLAGDAQAEFDKFVKGLADKLTDDQKIEFYSAVAEDLPNSAQPRLHIVDILIARHKLFEAVGELEKSADAAVAAGDQAPYSARLKAVVSAAEDSVEYLEPCGFLCFRIGDPAQGTALLTRVRDAISGSGDADRTAVIDRVLAALAGGWAPGSDKVFSFVEADHKLAEVPAPSPDQPPSTNGPESVSAAVEPIGGPAPDAAEAVADEGRQEAEEDASMVQDALGRLQAKVDEEIGDSDLDTRYNLGIAYKEMGLLDEASKEFRIAARKPELRLGATTLLADVLADQGDLGSALAELDGLIASGDIDPDGIRDVLYHKAILLEKTGRAGDAADLLRAIATEAPTYRDVRARIERLVK
ncbi:MAG TPA: hypothetical protein VGK27_12910 [Candidatus Deferrimicrobiaceae bacterium]